MGEKLQVKNRLLFAFNRLFSTLKRPFWDL